MKKRILIIYLILLSVLPLFASSGIRTATIEWLSKYNLSHEWIVVIISMLPIVELRGAIPVGIFLFKFSWLKTAVLSIIGNMLPIPFILLFMDGVVAAMRKTKLGRTFTDWLFARTRSKSKIVERYESVGLTIFVGIPLPGTGAWTGSFAAEIFGLKFWKSLLFIFLGVLLSAFAVTFLCQMGVIVFR